MNASRRLLALTLGTVSTGLLALGAPSVLAATATGTLTVKALVTNNCTVGNATLDFGTYSTVTGATGTTTANVNCSLLVPYTLTMDQGQNYTSNAGGSNRMKTTINATDYFLPYSLLFTGNVLSLPGVGTGLPVSVVVLGTAAAGANVPAGAYTDSMLMTVTF